MSDRDLLEGHLPLIEQAVASVCRRRRIFDQDAEDVRQEVLVRLAEDDCARLRSFRGESSLETFILVVTTRVCTDEIRKRRGRWRQSAIARQLGLPAVQLEMLVYRDGLSYEEAVARLVAEGVVRGREELDRAWPLIPERPTRRFVNPEDAPEPVSEGDPQRMAEEREWVRGQHRLEVALHESLEELPPEDRFVLTRLFFDGRSVTQVARELGLDQRPLYRRRDRLLSHLRNALEAKGLTWPDGGDGDSG